MEITYIIQKSRRRSIAVKENGGIYMKRVAS